MVFKTKKGAIEFNTRTIILMILVLVMVAILVVVALKLAGYGTVGISNVTNIAEGFNPAV